MAVRVFLILCVGVIGFLVYVLVCLVREGKRGLMPGQVLRKRMTRRIRKENNSLDEPKR
jgi:hypothetical protein